MSVEEERLALLAKFRDQRKTLVEQIAEAAKFLAEPICRSPNLSRIGAGSSEVRFLTLPLLCCRAAGLQSAIDSCFCNKVSYWLDSELRRGRAERSLTGVDLPSGSA